ncbi:sugar-phosphate nucleotidyltransferase [Thermocladium modestius]|uniref:Sugar-phosphate nucleotidyltransferase n=1 Tax=Thermocladium modestius TaxID=62609 RepID=A0A830GXP6_9CREN|nr:NTP transferase domain-containing protein [Thermocladium modestius]GGP21955.1 sugar-phosphate nucleotidyltransferase [Thermocladium modestius]
MRRSIWALILAGGRGVDMYPLVDDGEPKYLLNILGKPLIKYPVDAMRDLGIRRVMIASNRVLMRDDEVETTRYGENETDAIREIAQHSLRGTTVIIAYGDVVMPVEAYKLLLDSHLGSGRSLTAMVVPMEDTAGYVRINVTETQEIGGASRSSDHQPGYVLAGALAVEGDYLVDIMRGEFIELLGNSKGNAAMWSGWWIDVKYPWDVLSVIRNVMNSWTEGRISAKASVSSKASIEGVVFIDDGATVDHNATIRGPAYIGRKAYVGTNALIRNYAAIEEGCVVGAGAEITESSIQPFSTVGRGSFIGSSIMGSQGVMEPGVVTLTAHQDGAKIGDRKLGALIGRRARIGANSVMSPGTVVEPGKVVPPLSRL